MFTKLYGKKMFTNLCDKKPKRILRSQKSISDIKEWSKHIFFEIFRTNIFFDEQKKMYLLEVKKIVEITFQIINWSKRLKMVKIV